MKSKIKKTLLTDDLNTIREVNLNELDISVEQLEILNNKKKANYESNNLKLNVLDLFSGCGGISEGFAESGYFEIKGALDFNLDASKTFKFNFPNAKVLFGDITNLVNPEEHFKDVDIIVGGPPCQGFSSLNRHNKDLENDPRNLLFFEFLRIVKALKPKAILIENVRQILTQKDGFAKNKITELLSELGYNVSSFVLDASEFGVPQKRRRAFFIGVKKNIPIISIKILEKLKIKIKVNVKEAIGDLYKLEEKKRKQDNAFFVDKRKENRYLKILKNDKGYIFNHKIRYPNLNVIEKISHVKQGGNWKQVPENLFPYKRGNRHSNYLRRLDESDQSITIDTGHDVYFHPVFNRVPTVRESARIQSFPDDFLFLGKTTSQLRQVGNAVPPLLAKVLAIYINEVLTNEKV
jgi:DNA (cytosine-5)-methyltransferase 1